MSRTWAGAALLLGIVVALAEAAAPPPVETPERAKMRAEANQLNERGVEQNQQGRVVEASKAFAGALRLREKLYPSNLFPDGHPQLAESLNNLGLGLKAMGEPARALGYSEKALAMWQRLYPESRFKDGHPDLATSLNNLGIVLEAMGEPARARGHYEKALAMRERLYPESRFKGGHPDLAESLNNLGFVLQMMGEPARALGYYEKALAMRQRLYPESRFKGGHPDLAGTLNNLGVALQAMGEPARALGYYEKALAMRERLYPESRFKGGHPLLAGSLNNLGSVLNALGEPARALGYYEKALAMRQRLYPESRFKGGHPQLATSLHNLGFVLESMGEPARALGYYEKALAMRERLYPESRFKDGHPDLAGTLNNLGTVLKAMGEPARALSYHEKALAMQQRLYPESRFKDGHPLLAQSLNSLGFALKAMGEPARALGYYEKALAMRQRLSAELSRTASEAQALNHMASLPLTRDGYLSLTRREHSSDAYPLVWQLRGNLGRVYERRHLAALSAQDEKARSLFDEVVQLRRQRERLILAPAPGDASGRDDKFAAIDRRIGERDRELLLLVPKLADDEEFARATPADLRKALPKDAVFLDLLRYVSFEGKLGTKDEKRIPGYVAFIVRRERVERAELGPAAPIEAAIKLWRQAIREGGAGERYAQSLRRLVWEPIAKYLPEGTRTIYLAPDMALSALPWAALPGGKADKVLLEEYDLCLVPHGPWLLRRLPAPRDKVAARPTLLAVGGVAYDSAPPAVTQVAVLRSPPTKGELAWGKLDGTAREIEQLGKLAAGLDLRTLRADKADADSLLKALPAARYAHLATHGFFADAEFRSSALQLDEKLFARRESALGRGTMESVGAGARSPMVLSGLVCAGANRSDTPGRGIVTADSISLLDLRKMHLAVLSACETGLGETAGGEGVYGLQRAFHVGGCRNVVASLWKVEDEATAALMKLFYENLWHPTNPMKPREALRQAQLAIYRNPQHVKEWSQGRGPDFKTVLSRKETPTDATHPAAKTASPKLWAAWVLSGPGD